MALPPDDEKATRDKMLAWAEQLLSMRKTAGWQILMLELRERRDAALAQLIDVDAKDADAVWKLQREIQAYVYFSNTPERLIREGLEPEDAEEALEEGGDTDG